MVDWGVCQALGEVLARPWLVFSTWCRALVWKLWGLSRRCSLSQVVDPSLEDPGLDRAELVAWELSESSVEAVYCN